MSSVSSVASISEELKLLAFKSIANFISDITQEFGAKFKTLRLYDRLVSHTQIRHTQAILKHLEIFHDFCEKNRHAITSRDEKQITMKKLMYSERVYIDIYAILSLADAEIKPVIWEHLLTISAILDPSSGAKSLLQEDRKATSMMGSSTMGSSTSAQSGSTEENFLQNIISKVGQTAGNSASSADAMGSIMNSGIFSELMGGLQGGNMDPNKLMGAVNGMISSLSNSVGDDPEAKNMLSTLSSVTNAQANGQAPNIAGLMQLMTGLMSGMSHNTTAKVEEL